MVVAVIALVVAIVITVIVVAVVITIIIAIVVITVVIAVRKIHKLAFLSTFVSIIIATSA